MKKSWLKGHIRVDLFWHICVPKLFLFCGSYLFGNRNSRKSHCRPFWITCETLSANAICFIGFHNFPWSRESARISFPFVFLFFFQLKIVCYHHVCIVVCRIYNCYMCIQAPAKTIASSFAAPILQYEIWHFEAILLLEPLFFFSFDFDARWSGSVAVRFRFAPLSHTQTQMHALS